MLKKTAFVAFIILIIGIIFTGIGYATGAIDKVKEHYSNDTPLTTQTFDTIEELEFDLAVSDVSIVEDDVKSVTINFNPDQLNVKVKDKKLTISEKNTSKSIEYAGLKNIIIGEHLSTDATISIPKGMTLKEINGDIGSGRIKLNHLTINHANLSLDAAELDIKKTTINKGEFEVSVGSTTITDSKLTDVIFSVDAGLIDIEHTDFYGNVKLEVETGSIDIQTNEEQKDKINFEFLSEGINELDISKDFDRNHENPDATFIIDTEVGNITIN